MKGMWKILQRKVDDKAKRVLAAWLGICIVLELVMSGAAPMGIFADDGSLPVHEITVTEKSIRDALKNKDAFWDSEDVNLKIPYKKEEQKEAALEKVEELLLGMTVVTQKSGKDWSAIVAAYSDGDTSEDDFTVDQVILVGLNGNQEKNCIFRLKITNAEGIVIKTMTVTGYSMDGQSGSPGTPSEATSSEATPSSTELLKATDSDAEEEDSILAFVSQSFVQSDMELIASSSDAADVEEGLVAATSSELSSDTETREEGETERRYSYEEDYTLYMNESEIANVVEYRKTRSLLQASSPQEENELVEESRRNTAPPMMIAKAGAIVVASAESKSDGSNGNIAEVEVKAKKEEVETGESTSFFELSARYSEIDGTLPGTAYAMAQFTAENPDETPYRWLGEPDSKATSVDELEDSKAKDDWKQIEKLLTKKSYSTEGWKRIAITADDYYFYSADAGMAVMPVKGGGSSTSGVDIRFSFKNGVTKDGTKVTAKAGLLNLAEIIEAYKKPGHGSDEDIIKEKFIFSEDAEVKSTADFYWDNVQEDVQPTSLGNMLTDIKYPDGHVLFRILTKPNYKDQPAQNVHFTKAYTISDTMTFDGFYLDLTGYEVQIVDDDKANGDVNLIHKTNQKSIPLLELLITREANFKKLKSDYKDGDFEYSIKTKLLYENNDESTNKVTGVQFDYTLVNHTLDSGNPVDLKFYNGYREGVTSAALKVKNLVDNGILKYQAGPGGVPQIKNQVDFEAYSNQYKETDYSHGKTEGKTDGKTVHSSQAEISIKATDAYPLTKTAYHMEGETLVEAKEENKVFTPGSEIYYKIIVTNGGYSTDAFKIQDTLPTGINPQTVSLEKIKIGSEELAKNSAEWPKTENSETGPIAWEVKIPSGETAELLFKATIKKAEDFSKDSISTELENKACWYRSSHLDSKLAEDNAIVYVNLNQLTKENLEFEKVLEDSKDEGPLLVGDNVTYSLNARVTEEIKTEQWLTITDEWPGDQIELQKMSGIRPGSIVILKNEAGEEIARFENKGTSDRELLLPGDFTKNGKSMDAKDIPNIRYVEVSTYVPPYKEGGENISQGVTVILTGKLTAAGEIENKASTSVEGVGGAAKLHSLGMSIEKKAYYISQETAEQGINEENSKKYPVTPYLTFTAGDVVCYEVEVKNTGEALSITPVLTDDISKLFGEGTSVPELVEATLDGESKATAFYSIGTDINNRTWVSLPVENGKITLDSGSVAEEGIKPGESLMLRFYVRVPEGAIKEETSDYENIATASLELGGQNYQISAAADISTVPEGEQAVSIHKEVFAVGSKFDRPGTKTRPGERDANAYLEGARWNTPEIGPGAGYNPDTSILSVNKGDYVIYKVTLQNDGKIPLQIFEVEDWLPTGVEYDSFYEFGIEEGIRKSVTGTAKLYLGKNELVPYKTWQEWDSKLYYEDADGSVSSEPGAFIHFTSDNDYSVSNDGTYRAKLYAAKTDEEGKYSIDTTHAPTIRPGGRLVFGIIAKVNGTFDENTKELVNTAGVLVRKSVKKADAENGERDTAKLSGKVGTYDPSLYKMVTDTAPVKTDIYTPGIGKVLKQYLVSDQWKNYHSDNTSNELIPTDPMRWEITLSNGTNGTTSRGPIREYIIQDTLPLGLLYDDEHNTNSGSTERTSNYIKKGNSKQSLPSPEVSGDGKETPQVLTWKVTYNGQYYIQGAGELQKIGGDWSIPAAGTVTLMIGTKGDENVVRYGTYVNRAELIPGEQYPYQKQCAGELDYDSEGKIRSVYATAQVDIFGSGRTEAWKEIYYKGSSNIEEGEASGKDSKDNYVLAAASTEKSPSKITYKMNVGNRSEGGIENLVLIDHLPEPGDTGLINNSSRHSDFKVTFAEEPNVHVYLVSGDEETELKAGFTVTYGAWDALAGKGAGLEVGSALPDKHWKADDDSYRWSNSPKGMDCIRVVFSGEDGNEKLKELTKEANLVVTFDAVLPKAEELVDIKQSIAWNTFGYAYNKVGDNKLFTVEPAKVGVKIPTLDLYIHKTVESPIDYDIKEREYSFALEISEDGKGWSPVKEISYRIGDDKHKTEDGAFKLMNNQSAQFTVPANYFYRVKETDVDDFIVKVTPFGDSYSDEFGDYKPENPPEVTAKQAGEYYCIFKNIKTSLVLPETGGQGTAMFHKAGLATIALSLILLAFMGTGLFKKKEEEEIGGQV